MLAPGGSPGYTWVSVDRMSVDANDCVRIDHEPRRGVTMIAPGGSPGQVNARDASSPSTRMADVGAIGANITQGVIPEHAHGRRIHSSAMGNLPHHQRQRSAVDSQHVHARGEALEREGVVAGAYAYAA